MGRGLALGLWLALPGTLVLGQTIEHHPPPCMDTETFPLVEVGVSGADPGKLTLRFRSEEDAGWYETELEAAGDSFRAALPRPLPEAVRVRYYIASSENDVRTPEYVVNVLMGGCPGAREAPPELSEGIRIRRTSSDQSEIPAGFRPDGIRAVRAMSGTTLGIVVGAAGGATVAAVAAMGEEAAPAAPPQAPPQAIRACFHPDPIPDIESGGTILFDASCSTPATVTSYQWNFGDGTTGQGTSVEHRFIPGGIYSVTLTVADGQRTDSISRLVRVRATPTACFITIPNPPRIRANESISFNAECSVGDRDGGASRIILYEWDFGDGRPGSEGRFVSRQFTRPDVYGVTLTVTNDDGRQAKTTQFVVVERAAGGSRPGMTAVTFTSQLELPPGTSGQLSLNDSETLTAIAPSPQEYRARARPGENVVDGRLLARAEGAGRWRFDFRRAAGFVPGSILVDSGEVLGLDAYSVVFRLDGESSAPIRFRFRVEE